MRTTPPRHAYTSIPARPARLADPSHRRWARNTTHPLAWLLAASFAALTAVVPPAHADNAITVGALTLSANFHSVDFRLAYTHDDNSNATVLVRYWRSSQSITYADTAVVPLRASVDGQPRFLGMILWLEEGTAYHVRADVTDPDGGGTSVEEEITTRVPATHSPPSSNNIRWISPTGSDGNPGTSQASPKRTVASALTSLGGTPGQIRALPGVYYEAPLLTGNGSAGSYYSLVGAGNPDSVIFDSSDSAYLDTDWTQYRTAGNVWLNNIWFMRRNTSDSLYLVVAGTDQRLHRKVSVSHLITQGSSKKCGNLPDPSSPEAGFAQNGDTVFVLLEGDADPNATTMHIAKYGGIEVRGAYWRAESLTVRFSNGNAIFLGRTNDPATGAVVRNCRAINNGEAAFYVNHGTVGVLIDSCTVRDTRISSWSYDAVKCHHEEYAIGAMINGSNNVLRNSTLEGLSNGIGVTSGGQSSGIEIYHNTIQNFTDDAIEVDLGNDINLSIWGNYVANAIHGFSAVPGSVGPIYVLYNVFNNSRTAAIKEGGGNTATVHYHHNTMTAGSTSKAVGAVGGNYNNQVFRNNSMVGQGTHVLGDNNTMDSSTCSFDYNLEYRPNSTALWSWRGIDRTISYLRNILGYETHGVVNAPTYYDSTTGNFRPTASSAVIDSGTRVQGINTPYLTRNNNRLYTGNAPDIGAFEYGLVTFAQPLDRPDITAPAVVTNLYVTGGCTAVDVSWTAPGDDGSIGTAHHYDLRTSTSTITSVNFASATPVSTNSPGSPGTSESVNVELGPCSGVRYFALKTVDEVGNTSALSNVATGATPCVEFCEGGGAPVPVSTLKFAMATPAPNPANSPAELHFSIPVDLAKASLELSAFDPLGRRIRTIRKTPTTRAGKFSATWDLRDSRGRDVPNGVYYVRLQVGSKTLMRTLHVLR